MSNEQTEVVAAIQRTTTAMAQQWLHRIQVARHEARDTATERGQLGGSIRFSLEGRAITTVVEALIPEAEQMVMNHLRGTVTAADLPSPDQLLQAVETPIYSLIDSEISDLRSSSNRAPFFTPSSIQEGAITAAVTGIKPALAVLNSHLLAALQNRRAELISTQRAIDATTPKSKSETWWQQALRWIGVARNLAWVIGGLVAIALWVWNGFPLPF